MPERYISVYEKSLPDSLSLSEKLTAARDAGFDGLEISIDESEKRLSRIFSPELTRSTASEIHNGALPVRTMCLSAQRRFPLGSRDKKTREAGVEVAERAVDFACRAGIRVIQIPGYDVYYEESGEDTAEFFLDGLGKCVGYAAACGVILAFETMETQFMNTVEKAMKYVGIMNSPYLQIYPDLGNIRNGTENYIADLKSGCGHIAAVHLKDTLEGVYRNLELGGGRVDFPGCLEELTGQGVGIYNCEIWYDGKTEPTEYIRRNLEFARSSFPPERKDVNGCD